ncbi:hypothetical protein [Anditalea andensis]|uniref:DNA topoisomerase IV subunit B n=1 Tax=Anditalea andensis TaxID=1048983 RepID=A0A074KVP0_9BACT|nr:hypothetical protein [Anditalea andensis]KEO74046.1 hypothetical protein EL17_07825 [Anditalea andensis]
MYRRFAKAFHLLSVLLFVFLFMYIYAALPENVAYQIDERGFPLISISRDSFFYIGITVFLFLNFLLIIPAKLIDKQATLNLKKLFPKFEPFTDHMLGWFYSFAGVLNITVAIVALHIHGINNQNEINSSDFSLFYYMVPLFFIVWIIMLFVILGKKLKQVRS